MDRLKTENEKQIEQLRASMPKTGLLEERLLAVSAREDAFEQQLVETGVKMERIEKNKADASAVLSLMTRMEITEQRLRASNAEKERAVALLLAVYQLREAALSGQSFLTEQQAALALAAPDAANRRLDPFAVRRGRSGGMDQNGFASVVRVVCG